VCVCSSASQLSSLSLSIFSAVSPFEIILTMALPLRPGPPVLRQIGLIVVGMALLLPPFGSTTPAFADALVAAPSSSSVDGVLLPMSSSSASAAGDDTFDLGMPCGDPTGNGSVSVALSVSIYAAVFKSVV